MGRWYRTSCWLGLLIAGLLAGCAPPSREAPTGVGDASSPAPAPSPVVDAPPGPTPSPGGTGSTDEASASALRSIFYNATLAPQLARDPAAPSRPVLQAGTKTTLGFDIGPRRPDAAISRQALAEIAASKEDLPLTVVLGCDFCPPSAQFERDITYSANKGRSEWVQFTFTPEISKGSASSEQRLHLLIVNRKTGLQLDRMDIAVTVKNSAGEPAPVQVLEELAAPRAVAPDDDSTPLDVTIHATAAEGPSVMFSIEPHSPAMIRLLKPIALDAKGNRRKFSGSPVDQELIEQSSVWSFQAMSALTLQEKEWAKLRAVGVSSTVSERARMSLVLDDDEASNVARLMAATGKTLYRSFFHNGANADLPKMIALLEKAAAENPGRLRVQIITDRLSMPWQYLHPVGPEIDPRNFWGMKFSLNVVRSNDGGKNWRERTEKRKPANILFAHYGTSSDPSVPLAHKQIAALKTALPSMKVLPIYTGGDLIKHFRDEKDHISAFITFMHASSGAAGRAPFLQFGQDDVVEAADLDYLQGEVRAEDQDVRYLSLGPLVVLNACETGPAMRLPQTKLASALFRLGARGVVVTEVSVWQSLGDDMARRLIPRLINGETAADALSAARRELLQEKNNPLGLLYAYYGEPGAKLVRTVKENP